MSQKNRICTLNLSDWRSAVPEWTSAVCRTQKRLAEAFARLEKLEGQRAQGDYPIFGAFMEERIIWRELLELELQHIDELMERISATAADSD